MRNLQWENHKQELSKMANKRVIRGADFSDKGELSKVCGMWGDGPEPQELSRKDLLKDVEGEKNEYYVEDRDREAEVYVVERDGEKLFKTKADTETREALKRLPTCKEYGDEVQGAIEKIKERVAT